MKSNEWLNARNSSALDRPTLLQRMAGGALAIGLTVFVLVAFAAGVAQAQVQTYTCPNGFGVVPVIPVPPAVMMQSLKTIPNPVLPNGAAGAIRGDLTNYIANQTAAIQLGKALFWDMQAGSDNKTACATCHHQAGQDGRSKNQLNPGANGTWDGYAPNLSLAPADFPFTNLLAPSHSDKDNISGSQGVRSASFLGFSKSGAELTAAVADPVFNDAGKNTRQVTGKNTPSSINVVFNHRNFWNGRAQPEFNGVNPWGVRDGSAKVWVLGSNGIPVQMAIQILNASAASQAVGPPLSPVEMSAAGRTFADIGHKLLSAKPLALQRVDPSDSVLGSLADATTGKGLTTTYTALVQKAFQPKWWNYRKSVTVNGKSYSMMEANFSLFWGLSIMLYEGTLVADSSPMDQYLLTRVFSTTQFDLTTGMPLLVSHDPTRLNGVVSRLAADGVTKQDGTPVTTADVLNGLGWFERPVAPPPSFPSPPGFGVGCIGCHVGAETTAASVRNLTGGGVEIGAGIFAKAGFDLRMEREFFKLDWNPPGALSPTPLGADAITYDPSTYAVNVIDEIIPFPGGYRTPVSPIALPIATYDAGWYNLGVRPTADEIGLGGVDPFNYPLSWTKLFQVIAPGGVKVPGATLGCAGAGNANFPDQLVNSLGLPFLSGPLTATEATDVEGTFKVPGLRDVEFTGPYFHNGGKATLAQVVNFYDDGGDFDRSTNPTKHAAIVPLKLTQAQIDDLIAFLISLTDERVRMQQAPFDHPELVLPAGQDAAGADITTTLPAVGAGGSPVPLQRFLGLSPFSN